MYFRNLVFCAFALAVIASAVLSVYQIFWITPIIIDAETYEITAPILSPQSSEIAIWTPENGTQRHGWNFTSNLLVSFAFSLILLSVMSIKKTITTFGGIGWGGAAYLTVFVAPALGLPPEIPGMEAGYLEGRQAWWLFTVLAIALSLWLIAYQAIAYKIIGVFLAISPYVIGVPQPTHPPFINTNPQAIEALTLLWQQFVIQTSIANLLLWLVIGAGSGFLVTRYIHPLHRKT